MKSWTMIVTIIAVSATLVLGASRLLAVESEKWLQTCDLRFNQLDSGHKPQRTKTMTVA